MMWFSELQSLNLQPMSSDAEVQFAQRWNSADRKSAPFRFDFSETLFCGPHNE